MSVKWIDTLASIPMVLALAFALYEELKSRKAAKEEEQRQAMRAILAHSLHSRLSGMKWYMEMLLTQKFGKLRVSQMEMIHKMQEVTENSIELLKKMLDLTNIDDVFDTGHPTTIDINRRIQKIQSMFDQTIKQKKLEFAHQKAKGKAYVHMDPMAIHTVLETIISNAIAYTPNNGSVNVKAEEKNGKVQISVIDTGIGMSEEDRSSLFHQFYRGTKASQMDESGVGLGLYLTKQIVEHSGGKIECNSKEGKGTTFTVSLPKA